VVNESSYGTILWNTLFQKLLKGQSEMKNIKSRGIRLRSWKWAWRCCWYHWWRTCNQISNICRRNRDITGEQSFSMGRNRENPKNFTFVMTEILIIPSRQTRERKRGKCVRERKIRYRVKVLLPSMPCRISSAHGNNRKISQGGNGMCRKKPILNFISNVSATWNWPTNLYRE